MSPLRSAAASNYLRQQQSQRRKLDWLRVDYGIEKPSNKLLGVTELDSGTRVGEPATLETGRSRGAWPHCVSV
ncbi:MAG: hypothetical protein WCK27_09980 [Verrucomicrobiota bacterium]